MWTSTFLGVVLIEIDVGLLVGVILSLFVFYLKGFKSYSCSLGQMPGTDIYVDVNAHKNAVEVPHVKIFRFYGSINFATSSSFKMNLFSSLAIDQSSIRRAGNSTPEKIREYNKGIEFVVLDLQAVSHLDVRGYKSLVEIKKDLKIMEMEVFLANASDVVYNAIVKAVQLGEVEFDIFPTIHDAILYAKTIKS